MEDVEFSERVRKPYPARMEGEDEYREMHGPSKGAEEGLRSHRMQETPEKWTSKAMAQSIGTPTGHSEHRSVGKLRKL